MALFNLPRLFVFTATAALALSAVACSGADPTGQQTSPEQQQQNNNGDNNCGGLVAQATQVTFTTSTTIPVNPPPNVDVTLTDAATVQALFTETNALPALPPGTYNCPADFGVVYHLSFQGTGTTTDYLIDPGGCESVTIVGDSTVVLSTSPQYWQTLATALGIPESTIYPYTAPESATP